MDKKTYLRGTGFYVPQKVLTNQDLESMVDTSDEWIATRTGIKERHVAAQNEAASDMALAAAKNALEDAGLQASELTHIIVSTITPDTYCPSAACWLANKLGVVGATAFDVNAACSGFMYGLQVSRAMLALDPGAKVLLVASEVLTSRTNWTDRSTCVLFGDGAGAVVLTAEPENAKAELLDVITASDGQYAELLSIKGGGSAYPYELGEPVKEEFFIQMQGREVFKIATRTMEAVAREILERNGMKNGDVDLLIPHQANVRIIQHVGRRLDFAEDRVYINVDRYGNTSAASVGIALAEARNKGVAGPGTTALLVTFGGGLTWASGLIRFLD
jgi:3-oxoacyl-[acyl-carrier-protein] synthase-3